MLPRFRPHAAALTLCLALSTTAPAQHDNVLILLADDLGVDMVGAYRAGGTPPPTPHLDALARRGVLFRNAWSYPLCSPTRACIMTGRYGFRTGVGHAHGHAERPSPALSLDEILLPELLDRAGSGYAHAAIGKWHLGTPAGPRTPNVAGWSYFAGVLGGLAPFDHWPRCENGVTTTCEDYATTRMVDDALTWIREQQKPWVVYLAFTAPHYPWHAPPAHLHTRDLTGAGDALRNPWPYYAAAVEAMDSEIGRLLAELGSDLERTTVIFAGDNGTPQETTQPPFEGAHAKGSPYDGAVHVPLIVAGPAVGAPGREESALVSTVDLFATTAELAGVDARRALPAGVALDSVSFVSLLGAAGRPPVREHLFAETFFGGPDGATRSNFAALRDARYRLIRRFAPMRDEEIVRSYPADELYDLQTDPFERHDLLAAEPSADLRAHYDSLVAALQALERPTGAASAMLVIAALGSLCLAWSALRRGDGHGALARLLAIAVPGALLVALLQRHLGHPRLVGLGLPMVGVANWLVLGTASFLAGNLLFGAERIARRRGAARFACVVVAGLTVACFAYLLCGRPPLVRLPLVASAATELALVLGGSMLLGPLLLLVPGAVLDRLTRRPPATADALARGSRAALWVACIAAPVIATSPPFAADRKWLLPAAAAAALLCVWIYARRRTISAG